MSVTATKVFDEVPGAEHLISGTVTFDNSYVTGGEPITPTILGASYASTILWMVVTAQRGVAGTVANAVQFDATNQKLLVFNTTAGAQTANATDLSLLICDYIALVR